MNIKLSVITRLEAEGREEDTNDPQTGQHSPIRTCEGRESSDSEREERGEDAGTHQEDLRT